MSKLVDIGILVASFGVGFLFLYFFLDLPKEKKKKQIDEILSQLINFILFTWLGKIVLNFNLFISDPIAVLAYPGNSNAFYFAVIATALVLLYKVLKKNFAVFSFLYAFLYVFIAAAFVYEFIDLTNGSNQYAFYLFLLYFMLLVFIVTIKNKLPTVDLFIVLFSAWSLGMVVLDMMQPFITIFGFTVHTWFIILFYVLGMIGLFYQRKKSITK